MECHLESLGAGAAAPWTAPRRATVLAAAGPWLRLGAGGQGARAGAQAGCEAPGPWDVEPGGELSGLGLGRG